MDPLKEKSKKEMEAMLKKKKKKKRVEKGEEGPTLKRMKEGIAEGTLEVELEETRKGAESAMCSGAQVESGSTESE